MTNRQERIKALKQRELAKIPKSVDGKPGDNGLDGYTPKKDVDYFDGKPGRDGVDGEDGLTPIKGKDYFDGKPGKTGADGKKGETGLDGKKGVIWRGNWITQVKYNVDDAVHSFGSSYICIKDHKSSNANRPPTGNSYLTYWSVLAERGESGPGGSAGAQGVPGPSNDATATIKGAIKLTNDLGGTADIPTVTFTNDTLHLLKSSNLSDVVSVSTSITNLGLGNVDNTSDVNKPVSTAQATADSLRVLKAGDTMGGSLQQTPTTGVAGYWLNALPSIAGTASRLSSYSSSLPALTLRAGTTMPITNKSLTSNVATITTAAAHGYAVGRSVIIEGLGSPFDGTYTIASAPTTTTFTYSKTASNVTSIPVTLGTGYAGNNPFGASNEPPALVVEDSTGVERVRIVGDDGRLVWPVSGVSGGVAWGPSAFGSNGRFLTDATIQTAQLLIGSGATQVELRTNALNFNTGSTFDSMSLVSVSGSLCFVFSDTIRVPKFQAGALPFATPLGTGEIVNVNATDKGLVIKGAASQSASLQEWQDSTGAILAKVDKAGHLYGGGTAPAVAAGAGAGTTPTVALTGSDMAGKISITTGTLPTLSADVFTVTFNTAYASAPYVNFSPANAVTALLSGASMVYVTAATTTFKFTAGTTPLTAATTYLWNY